VDLFEFILIITSVIFALAVAQILSGISRIAQSAVTVRPFLAHTLWVFNLFIFIFLIWWATWEFRDVSWTFPKYAYMLIAPTLLYFACSLLVPQRLEGADASMEAHFFRVRRPLLIAYFFASLAVIIDGNLLVDEPLWHNGRYGHVALLSLAALAYFSESRNVHKLVAFLTLLTFSALVVVRFWDPR
jgi:hypothetical protein